MRQPKRGLEDIIKSDEGNGFPTAETEPETAAEQPEPKKRTYPSREGKVPVQVFLNKDAHRQLKITSAERDVSIQDILIESLNDWCVLNGLPPIA